MITKFNIYENKLNEDIALPSWVDEKIIKPAGGLFDEYGKPLLSIPGTEKNEIDENLKKLYNTPIANIPVYAYAELMDIMDEDRAKLIKLESPLTIESPMLSVAANYYINNIANIIESVNKVDITFNPDGIDPNVAKVLRESPVTIGTIIRNSLIDWYLSKTPEKNIIDSLNTAVLEVREEDTKVSEDYDFINESKLSGLDRFRKWIGTTFKSGDELKGAFKSAEEAARFTKEFKPASSTDDALRQMDQSTEKLVKNIDDAPNEIKGAVNQKISDLKQTAKDMNVEVPTKSSPKMTTSATDLSAKRPDISASNPSGDASKTDEAKGFFQRLKEARAKAKDKSITRDKPKKFKWRSLLTNTFKGLTKIFTLGGFLLKVPKAAWGIVKYGGIAYGIYWIAKWYENKDSQSAYEPTRELMSTFEKDLAHRKFEPFVLFNDMGERFEKSSASGDIREQLKAWCTSLNIFGVLSDSDYQKCIEQIESDAFYSYIEANSTASRNFVDAMLKEWENIQELPSLGLLTMGLASAYSSVFHKFENEFYNGKIPLTADVKNLNRPVSMIRRFDEQGNERKYMQLGDEGEDVKLLQTSLNRLNLYSGEIDGKYDEEMAKIISSIQTNAKPTNTEIEINGKADLPLLNYLAKQIEFLSGIVKGSIEGTVSQEEYQKRQQTQGYIQQMQAALANR